MTQTSNPRKPSIGMSYYEQRLAKDLESIRAGISDLGSSVSTALRDAAQALLTRDHALAFQTIIGDNPINRATEDLDRECHFFIARHLPSAGPLRFISSAMRLIMNLERMGDYAVTISRESVQMTVPLSGDFRARVESMSEDAFKMLSQALTAFRTEDIELARETMAFARTVNSDFSTAFDLLVQLDSPGLSREDLFGRLIAISQIGRVSDQAKNICEVTVFALTGETKVRRRVRILILETGNASFSRIAVAIGRKYFSDRAEFTAGVGDPGSPLSSKVEEFLQGHGLESDFDDFIDLPESWDGFDVVISLNRRWTDYGTRIPFHTVAFDWRIPVVAGSVEPLSDAYRFLMENLESLIVTMRGSSRDD